MSRFSSDPSRNAGATRERDGTSLCFCYGLVLLCCVELLSQDCQRRRRQRRLRGTRIISHRLPNCRAILSGETNHYSRHCRRLLSEHHGLQASAHKLLRYDRLASKERGHEGKIKKKSGPVVKHTYTLTRRSCRGLNQCPPIP